MLHFLSLNNFLIVNVGIVCGHLFLESAVQNNLHGRIIFVLVSVDLEDYLVLQSKFKKSVFQFNRMSVSLFHSKVSIFIIKNC